MPDMPIKRPKDTASAPTRGLEALRDELLEHSQVVVRVEVRTRSGSGGRPKATPALVWEPSEDGPIDAELAYGEIVGACEELDAEAGPWFFVAHVVVQLPGEAAQKLSPITFRLTEDDPSNEMRQLVVTQQKTLRHYDTMLQRAFGRMDDMSELLGKTARAHAELLTMSTEMRRLDLEHEREMAKAEAEERRAEAELELVKELAPKWMATHAARQARKEDAAKGGPKKPAWLRLKELAASVLDRDDVCRILGERGVDLVCGIADAESRAAVEGPCRALGELVRAGEIDGQRLVVAVPELLSFADMLGLL